MVSVVVHSTAMHRSWTRQSCNYYSHLLISAHTQNSCSWRQVGSHANPPSGIFATGSKWLSKYQFLQRDYVNTCNTLTLWTSGEQIRLQLPPKLFGVNIWIPQIIRQWIPDCWSRRQQMHGSQKCCGELAELTVIWWHPADRRCWRQGTSETDTRQSARYLLI